MKKIFYILLILISFVFLTGCQDDSVDLSKNYDFSAFSFESIEISYDGNEHSIYATNIPSGLVVEYEGNGVSEIGNHTVIVKLYTDSGEFIKEFSASINIVEQIDVELPFV